MLTADEYYQFTGYLAPADFNSCLAVAEQRIHAETLFAYVGRNMEELPSFIQNTWKQAVALQTCAVSQNGGVAGMSQQPQNSVSLGSSAISISPGARALLPVLISYGRGLRSCFQSH